MTLYSKCPLGRLSCDTCYQNTTGGCSAMQYREQFSITRDEMFALYDRRREELMKLSKEDLVELIIGRRENVGLTFG